MLTKVKICGIKSPKIAQYAVGLGASFVGVVFFEKSPRKISYEEAAIIHKAISGNAKLVAVMVSPEDSEISEMLSHFTPEYIQLHGDESPARVYDIKQKFNLPLIKAISVSSLKDIKKADIYHELVDYILFDAKPPKGSELPGGNAISFDWSFLKGINLDKRYFLSGGINPNNIEEALKISGARYIDVSSGVESARGIKSKKLIFNLFEKVNKV